MVAAELVQDLVDFVAADDRVPGDDKESILQVVSSSQSGAGIVDSGERRSIGNLPIPPIKCGIDVIIRAQLIIQLAKEYILIEDAGEDLASW